MKLLSNHAKIHSRISKQRNTPKNPLIQSVGSTRAVCLVCGLREQEQGYHRACRIWDGLRFDPSDPASDPLSDQIHRLHTPRLPLHLLITTRDLSQRSRPHTRRSPYGRVNESCLNALCICRGESRVIQAIYQINSKNGEYHIHPQAPRILRRDAAIHLLGHPTRATRYTRCTHGHRLCIWGRQAMES